MAERPVIRRYVHSLFQVAAQQNLMDAVLADLTAVDAALRESPRLMRVLRAPTIARERKLQLLERAFGERVDPLTLRFLQLLVRKRRETVLPGAHAEFRQLAYERQNLLPVEVTTAVPMDDALRDSLKTALEKRTGKTVEMRTRLDAAILGGAVVRLEDTVLDGSVRSYIQRVRQQLLTAPIRGNGARGED